MALRVASRRAKFIHPLKAEGFLWLFCKQVKGAFCGYLTGLTRQPVQLRLRAVVSRIKL